MLDKSTETPAQPTFSPVTQPNKIPPPPLPSPDPETATAPETAPRLSIKLDQNQVDRVVAQSVSPAPSAQIDRVKIKAIVAQSFGGPLSGSAVTAQTLSPIFSAPAPSPRLEPDRADSDRSIEALYVHSSQADSKPEALQIAQMVNPQPATVGPTACS